MGTPDKSDADILIAQMAKEFSDDDTIEQNIRDSAATLAVLDKPTWGNQADNIDYMKTLQFRIRKLQDALLKPPVRTGYFMLFAPEDGENVAAMIEEAQRRQDEFMAALGALYIRCEKNIAEKPGLHGKFGFRERYAAVEARQLWERHGRPPTLIESFIGFAENLFRVAWPKERPQDMRRACAEALRSPIKTDIPIV